MLLSVVIVNYNVKFYLAQCLWALQQTCGVASMEIIVVDNHSTDGSIDFLKQRFPNVRFILCQHNLGFAKANNIGIRQSQGEYVLLYPSEFKQAQCHGNAADGEQFHECDTQKFGGYEAMCRAHPFKDIVFVEDNPQ